jgi:AcrR family transcriptional regulator
MMQRLAEVNTLVYGRAVNERLTKVDWIRHGLRTLANDGANALKIGSMATKLGVSRGSFYWHFRDIAEFRSEVLRSWQDRATDQVIQEIEAESKPERLKQLLQRAFDVTRRSPRATKDDDWTAERAIRSWATEDANVAATVASVDASRVAYIAKLLVAAGVEPQRALSRATFMYWAYLGQVFVMNPRHFSLGATAMDDLGELFASGRTAAPSATAEPTIGDDK